MPNNSIQFQKGFSIPEFMQMYGKRVGNYTLIFTFQGKTDSTSPGFVHQYSKQWAM